MNNNLMKIYEEHAKFLSLDNERLVNVAPPLLLRVSEKYEKSENRVIVFGQETQGWGCVDTIGFGTYPDYKNIVDGNKKLCDLYEGFCFSKYSSHKKSPFWRAFRQISEMKMSEEYFESTTIWNNLIKIDYKEASIKSLPWNEQVKCVEYSTKIILEELEVLKPKVCVLFTGPSYDGFLNMIFGDVDHQPVSNDFTVRQLSTFEKNGIRFFRTYHPNYLQRNTKKGYWGVVDEIQRQIKKM